MISWIIAYVFILGVMFIRRCILPSNAQGHSPAIFVIKNSPDTSLTTKGGHSPATFITRYCRVTACYPFCVFCILKVAIAAKINNTPAKKIAFPGSLFKKFFDINPKVSV